MPIELWANPESEIARYGGNVDANMGVAFGDEEIGKSTCVHR